MCVITLEYYEEIGGNGILNHNQSNYKLYLVYQHVFQIKYITRNNNFRL